MAKRVETYFCKECEVYFPRKPQCRECLYCGADCLVGTADADDWRLTEPAEVARLVNLRHFEEYDAARCRKQIMKDIELLTSQRTLTPSMIVGT